MQVQQNTEEAFDTALPKSSPRFRQRSAILRLPISTQILPASYQFSLLSPPSCGVMGCGCVVLELFVGASCVLTIPSSIIRPCEMPLAISLWLFDPYHGRVTESQVSYLVHSSSRH
jgi:hypothetical protein